MDQQTLWEDCANKCLRQFQFIVQMYQFTSEPARFKIKVTGKLRN